MLANLRISHRLALTVAVPLLLLVGLAAYNLNLDWRTRGEMVGLERLATDVAKLSRLIHEMQRERGASAVFVGSKGTQLRDELAAQRKLTDQARKDAATTWDDLRVGSDSGDTIKAVEAAAAAVNELDAKRAQIDNLSIAPLDSNAYFTASNGKLLAVAGEIARASGRGDVTTAISSYVSFMQAKERAGQERATGAAGISGGKFELATYARVLSLAAVQDSFFDAFKATATSALRDFYAQTLAGSVTEDVVKMRETILHGGLSGQMSGLDGPAWYKATTARIDKMKVVEDRIAEQLAALTASIREQATHELALLAALTAAGLLASFGLVYVMARSIIRPVARMTGAMTGLAAGNLDIEIPADAGNSEIADMARAVRVFKDNAVRTRALEAEQRDADARAAAQRRSEMHQLADNFEAAIGEIVEAVSSASSQLESSATMLTATAGRSQELAAAAATASQDAATNAQSVSASTEELSSSVNEISRQVQESAAVAGQAVEQADRTNDSVSGLAQAAARIGAVVELINTVAAQTNLLALNATIEAARAGEAGRGFAVVASEVKALAAQTAKATDEISQQIAAIQTSTADSVKAIGDIRVVINRMSEISSTIASAVEEQGAATQEISRNVQQSAAASAQVNANIGDLRNGANATGSASTQVLSAAQALSTESGRLRTEVTRFLGTVRAA